LTELGISQVDRKGNKTFIAWDEIGSVSRGTGMRKLCVLSTDPKKRIFIPGHMDQYQRISDRILTEYQKRRDPSDTGAQIYLPSMFQYWFATIFILALALTGPVSFIGMLVTNDPSFKQNSIILLAAGFFVLIFFGWPGIYLLRHTLRFSKSRLELTASGITQFFHDGEQTFISWNDLGTLSRSLVFFQINDVSFQKKI
jgi:hypothetical protein